MATQEQIDQAVAMFQRELNTIASARYTVNAITVMGTILLTRQHQTWEQALALESLWREKYPGLCPIMEIEQA